MLFLVVIAIPAVAWRLGMNAVLAFWFAYTVTRPLGASVADWLGVPARLGGLDWGRGVVAAVMTVPIVAVVAYMAISAVDVAGSRDPVSCPAARGTGPPDGHSLAQPR